MRIAGEGLDENAKHLLVFTLEPINSKILQLIDFKTALRRINKQFNVGKKNCTGSSYQILVDRGKDTYSDMCFFTFDLLLIPLQNNSGHRQQIGTEIHPL